MTRRPLTQEQENDLQLPIAQALAAYFEQAYTPDSKTCSVGSAVAIEGVGTLVYNAFILPAEALPAVRAFMAMQAKQYAKIATNNDSED